MSLDGPSVDRFSEFFSLGEPKLRHALTAALGWDIGREAAAEALAYGWEHWDRISEMDNPEGYLYRVGLTWGRSKGRRRRLVSLPQAPTETIPWIEPGLPKALARLSENQRVVVFLVWGQGWSLSEIAQLQGVSKGTVQKHLERGMEKLRRQLKVDA